MEKIIQEKIKVLELTDTAGELEYNELLTNNIVRSNTDHLTKTGQIFRVVSYVEKTQPFYNPPY